MKQKHSEAEGFTLIETAIALVILTVALLGVAGVITYSTKFNSGATDRALALVVAQQQMEVLRNSTFTSTDLSSATQTTTVTNAGYNFTVVVTITDTTPTRKTITVQVSPDSPSSPWAKSPVILTTQRSALTLGSYIG